MPPLPGPRTPSLAIKSNERIRWYQNRCELTRAGYNAAVATQSLVNGVTVWGIMSGQRPPSGGQRLPALVPVHRFVDPGAEGPVRLPPLSLSPSAIHSVTVKSYMLRTDAGARTIDLVSQVSGTDYTGSNPGFTPAASPAWAASYFRRDPSTSA